MYTQVERPQSYPTQEAGRADVKLALQAVADYRKAGGEWTDTLRRHTDRWLDRMLEIQGR